MARYSAAMARDQTLPHVWLISDSRNDAVLERVLRKMPRGSGFVYRHYHLGDPERWERFCELRRFAKARGHMVILADSALTATEWGADGVYGAPLALWPTRRGLIQIAAVHSMREIAQARRKGADAVMLSPVFPTRSHPGSEVLGPVRFQMLARLCSAPVIALGGMDVAKARAVGWNRWAAIDGLSLD